MPRLRDALGWLLPARAETRLRRAETSAGETKASLTAKVVAWETLGRPVWSPRDYRTFAVEGFAQNPIVYRSVRMIAEAAASIPLLLYAGDEEIETHPFVDLMRRPSFDATGTDFLESFYGFLLVSGNAYAEAVAVGGELRELHALRPDRMKVIPGPDGWPEGFEYTAGGRSVRLEGEAIENVRRVLHVKLFHPTDDHYGMSPIEAAAVAIDTHNTAAQWNKALLDNAARPSGALVYASRDGNLSDEQFSRLKAELEAGFQGAKNAGRPLLLEGGLDWKPLSLTPKDMDFVEAKNAAAREIALALGVPPMLLGIPGDNTYSNYQEASRSFWRQTVLPIVNRTAKAMSHWLAPAYGGGLELRPDLDQIEVLASEREALWTRIGKAEFLTEDEKRAATGYGPKGDATDPAPPPEPSRAAKFNPYHDEAGRFTTADGAGGGADPFAETLPEIVVGQGEGDERDGGVGEDPLLESVLFDPVSRTIEAALALFTVLSSQNSVDQTAVLGFRAEEFSPGADEEAPAFRVGTLTREQVDAACPRHGEVQSLTDAAADTATREGNYLTAGEYGTQVHSKLKQSIKNLDDPNFRAEVSAIKSKEETYGKGGSIRVDVLENVGDGTVCVYDIKTGKSSLTPARMKEIANNVHSLYPGTKRTLVIATRPGAWRPQRN